MKLQLSRRQFLATSTVVTSSVVLPTFVPRSVFADGDRPGANERIGIAGIGVGRQGSVVVAAALRDPRTVGVCICDAWKNRAEDFAGKHVGKHKGILENVYQDYRRVIERSDVDAILTATPEHWRSLICVNAALAGKHLYVEKPITLTVEDGKLLRKAANKTGIVFQSGSQQRSDRVNHLACKFIREGHLGKILEVEAANFESPWLSNLPAEPVPDGLDWDWWCGPTEPVPFNRQLFVPRGNPGWLSFRPYSGGEMTGWGCHGFDQIQCALGVDGTGPVEIFVEGGRLEPPTYDKTESMVRGNGICSKPDLSFRYANGLMVKMGDGNRGGGIFVGEKGKVEISRSKMASDPAELAQDYLKQHADFKMPSHVTNWIDCIYSGEKPISNLEIALATTNLCHILSIARYVGRDLKWDPAKEEFVGDAEANALLRREYRKGFELPPVA